MQTDLIVEKATKYAKENPLVIGGLGVVTLAGSVFVWKKSMKRDGNDYDNVWDILKLFNNDEHKKLSGDVGQQISKNDDELFKDARKKIGAISTAESIAKRKAEYEDMVNNFYDLVTDFYEWGWGQSFHFGPRRKGEGFMESIKRTEYYLGLRLGMGPTTKALDVGCGVGGPMRNIAAFTGSNIKGVTINKYQVDVGNKNNEQWGLRNRCELVQGNFQKLTEFFTPESFDVAYAIEATCHSPNRVECFTGVFNCLKPGGMFAGYEWVMINGYDAKNVDHVRIKEGIEVGNGLPTLTDKHAVIEALQLSGFEVLEDFDANQNHMDVNEIPWYETLMGKFSFSGFRMTHVGRMCTHTMVFVLEVIGLAPKGTTKVSALLNATALDLCEGGVANIFTPSYFFLARKPLLKK